MFFLLIKAKVVKKTGRNANRNPSPQTRQTRFEESTAEHIGIS